MPFQLSKLNRSPAIHSSTTMNKDPGPQRDRENEHCLEILFSQEVNIVKQWNTVVVFCRYELNSAWCVTKGN